GGVLHVEKNFGSLHFFERGTEARNQCVGKVADETDSIGEQNLAARRKLQPPEFGVERSEHPGRFKYTGLGKRIEEGAFAGVGVTNERDHGDRNCLASLPLLMTDAADT